MPPSCREKASEMKVVFPEPSSRNLLRKSLCSSGVNCKNILLVDSKGVVYKGRKEGMNGFKEAFAVETSKEPSQRQWKEQICLQV